MAGILLAIAPLVAGLMLFGITRSIFVGWAKGLVMTYLASIALALILGVELALLEPWLQDTLARRAADLQTLDAPVEVLVVTLAFALIAFASLAIVAWIAFHPSALVAAIVPSYRQERSSSFTSERFDRSIAIEDDSPTRAERVSLAVSDNLRREQRLIGTTRGDEAQQPVLAGAVASGVPGERPDTLGTSYRRNARRISAASQRRDDTR
jgi:type IV secretion system protein VirB6